MKRIMLSLTLMLSVLFAVSANEGPVATWNESSIDYGTITQGSDGTRVFEVTNTGNAPLIISNATGSCGCTVPSWPKEPILPGKTAELKVHYDTNRLGSFTKTVTVISNSPNNTDVLQIKGNVVPKE